MTPQEIEALKAERDALAAQVEAMRSAMINACNVTNLAESEDQANAVYMMESVLRKTPQQCLRDVQAEAGRKGYYEGFRAGIVIDAPLLPPQSGVSAIDHFRRMVDHAARVNADNYAATVRQGGAA